jgi:hypothetical protein
MVLHRPIEITKLIGTLDDFRVTDKPGVRLAWR